MISHGLLRVAVALTTALVAASTWAAEVSAARFDGAMALLSGGHYAAAVGALTRLAHDATVSAGERARAYVWLGDALIASGDAAAASDIADTLERARTHQPPAIVCAVDLVRASVALARSEVAAEIAAGERGVACADRAGDAALVGLAVNRLFYAYFSQRQSDRALVLANDRLASTPHDRPNRANFLSLRARALLDSGDWTAVSRALGEALPLATASGDSSDLADIHEFLGLLAWRSQRDRTRALRELDLALTFARRRGLRSSVAMILSRSAMIYSDGDVPRANIAQAASRLEEARTIARDSQMPVVLSTALSQLGLAYRRVGDRARAAQVLDEAIAVADRAEVREIRWTARLLAAIDARDADTRRADRLFDEALAVLEQEARDRAVDDVRAGSFAQEIARTENPYDRYVDFLLASGQPEHAFFVAERERARVLLDTLSAAHDALKRDAPAQFSADERRVLGRIRAAQAVLRTPRLAQARSAELLAEIEGAETELSELRVRLALDRPALAHARYPTLLQAADVQKSLLAADETLVSFYLGRDRSAAWIVGRDAVTIVSLPPRQEVERTVRDALLQLKDPAADDTAPIAALSAALAVDRIAAAVRSPRLIVVPHGVLYDVPFEALRDGTGRTIVERFAVSYAPSASTLAILRGAARPTRQDSTVIAVADPVVSVSGTATARQIDLQHVGLLSRVPHSADEVRAIAALFGSRVRVLERGRARRAELLHSGLEHARIIHFATHGLVDEAHPERSGLVLTADPPNDDGLLQARDIYGLHVDADLVTLSACETALGQNVTGEGMIGLTRAFLYAGAGAVVASLWDIDDASTARLMQRFYANIGHGEPIDAALQHAKIEFIHGGGATARPFHWAAFIATGQARAPIGVPMRVRRADSRLVAAVGSLLCGLMLALAWGRRRMATAGRSRTSAVQTT